MPKINAFLQKQCFSSQQGFWSEWNLINRQARSWDHLAAILTLLPTRTEMLPSGFFRSLRATGMHFGRRIRRKKWATFPKPHFFHLQVGGVSVDFNSVEEFIFMILTYRLCCLRRISQLIGNFFLKFWWRKGSSDSLTKYSLNTCYVSGTYMIGIMLCRRIWRFIKKINNV